VAGGKRAIALFRGRARRGDKVPRNSTCLVVRLEDGKAVEIRQFVWNLFEVDDFR
jgi:ketosteroid isomerase-like protein